jgi:hypothetical protein
MTSNDSQPFMKFDSNKPMLSLVDPAFTWGVGQVLTHGAEKYAIDNWKKVDDIRRYKDAAYRHFLAYLAGELRDPDSGLPHLDHLGANIMFLRYFTHGKGVTNGD